jgi:ADP-ribose pyrophosphatase YjhB (NUDIX family)
MMKDATLVFLVKGKPVSEVLLGYKKIGFGKGKYTGFGGKIECGEAIEEAALRELTEETGLWIPQPEALDFRAILEFRFPSKRSWEHRVFAFVAHHWEGILKEGEEMRPEWFPIEKIPYFQMWDDARYWLPKLLSGDKIRGIFIFKEDNSNVATATYKLLNS